MPHVTHGCGDVEPTERAVGFFLSTIHACNGRHQGRGVSGRGSVGGRGVGGASVIGRLLLFAASEQARRQASEVPLVWRARRRPRGVRRNPGAMGRAVCTTGFHTSKRMTRDVWAPREMAGERGQEQGTRQRVSRSRVTVTQAQSWMRAGLAQETVGWCRTARIMGSSKQQASRARER